MGKAFRGSFPKAWTSLLICWVSRKLLQQSVSLMPSHCLRLPQKNCGLFDTGFAGSTSDAVSFGMNAPLAAVDNSLTTSLTSDSDGADFLLGEFEFVDPGKVLGSNTGNFPQHIHPHETSAKRATIGSFNQQQQQKLAADTAVVAADIVADASGESAGWSVLEDSFADLGTDQLGDNSLDAFINLDQLLMGLSQDAFLDGVSEVQPVIQMKPQEPVSNIISIPTPEAGGDAQQQFDFFDLFDGTTEVTPAILNPSPIPAPVTNTTTKTVSSSAAASTKGNPRKRKATTKPATGPVKTSMFEIPVSENVVSTTTYMINPCSPEHDHDYTTKQKSMEFVFDHNTITNQGVSDIAEPSTSNGDNAVSVQVLDKQSIRRHKNNVASKRSREQRKQKFSDLDREAEDLIVRNEALRKKIVELEKTAREMKGILVAKMSGK